MGDSTKTADRTTDLGEVLGTLLASLAHARRIADEESAVIAEHYRDTPLLEGMSLPRVRLPEMVVNLPVLIEEYKAAADSVPSPEPEIRAKARQLLAETAQAEKVKLPKLFLGRFEREMRVELGRLVPHKHPGWPVEEVVRAADNALLKALEEDTVRRFTEEQVVAVRKDLRRQVGSIVLEKEGHPPSLAVTVVTSEIKERTAPQNVARLQMTLKEEGMEWTMVEQSDGSVKRVLTPE